MEGMMFKKLFLFGIFFVFAFLVSGCTLVKGTGGAVVGCAQGASEGFKEDVGFVKKADNWVKENLW